MKDARTVTLRGGPFDGVRVTVTSGAALLMQGEETPDVVARYRPSREKGVYSFRGMDKIVAHIPFGDAA